MRRSAAGASLAVWLLGAPALSGCGGEQRNKRQEAVDLVHRLLLAQFVADPTYRLAQNAVIRNNMDCDTVNAALPEANRKLDEAAGKIRTPAGRATLESLKAQVRTAAQNCPPGDVVRQQPPPP